MNRIISAGTTRVTDDVHARVPTAGQIVDALRAAGFANVSIDLLGQHPCFHAGATPLREIRVSARKPERATTAIPVAPASCCTTGTA